MVGKFGYNCTRSGGRRIDRILPTSIGDLLPTSTVWLLGSPSFARRRRENYFQADSSRRPHLFVSCFSSDMVEKRPRYGCTRLYHMSTAWTLLVRTLLISQIHKTYANETQAGVLQRKVESSVQADRVSPPGPSLGDATHTGKPL